MNRCLLPLPALVALLGIWVSAEASEPPTHRPQAMGELIARSTPEDWRPLDSRNTLYMDLASGRVIIELCPEFAPKHTANIKTLAREHYFDGLSILRCQDNYVVQWGDPDAEKPEKAKKITKASKLLAAEFDRPLDAKLPFTGLPDGDVYASEVGFHNGFPAARDAKSGRMWLIHTYGMVGAGRDNSPDSGGGTELYVVIGHSPRHLDRNVTLVGRVIVGMELLSSLPRGPAPMGFYEKASQRVPIRSVRIEEDIPESERTRIEVMKTSGRTFLQILESRRNRPEEWFVRQAGRIEIGNVPLPSRPAK